MRGETSVTTSPQEGFATTTTPGPTAQRTVRGSHAGLATFEPQFSARSDRRLGLGCKQDSRVTRYARLTACNTSPAPCEAVHFAEAADGDRAALEPDFFCRVFRRRR
jgi:hypothetical protein